MKVAKRREIFFGAIIIAALIFLSFYFDFVILRFFESIRNSVITNILMGVTFVSSIFVVFVFLTLLFIKERRRRFILPLWLTLFITTLISFILKVLVQRHRPYQLNLVSVVSGLAEHAHEVWDFSFPSFQSALVFCALPFLTKEFPKFRYIWIVFAVVVALSRVYFGVHFMSDVLCGAIIGYLVGWFLLKNEIRLHGN